jgi:hypothetical protein
MVKLKIKAKKNEEGYFMNRNFILLAKILIFVFLTTTSYTAQAHRTVVYVVKTVYCDTVDVCSCSVCEREYLPPVRHRATSGGTAGTPEYAWIGDP